MQDDFKFLKVKIANVKEELEAQINQLGGMLFPRPVRPENEDPNFLAFEKYLRRKSWTFILNIPDLCDMFFNAWKSVLSNESGGGVNISFFYDSLINDLAGFSQASCETVLAKLAFEGIKKQQLAFTSEEVQDQINRAGVTVTHEYLLSHHLLQMQGEEYIFLYPGFQKVFAAKYLAQEIIQDQNSGILEFIRNHREDPKYKLMWAYTSYLLKNQQNLELFWKTLWPNYKSLRGLYSYTLYLRCLREVLGESTSRKLLPQERSLETYSQLPFFNPRAEDIWPREFFSLTERNPEQNLRTLLEEYYKNGTGLRAFFRLHWFYHHTQQVGDILLTHEEAPQEALLTAVKTIELHNPSGTLSSRMGFGFFRSASRPEGEREMQAIARNG